MLCFVSNPEADYVTGKKEGSASNRDINGEGEIAGERRSPNVLKELAEIQIERVLHES